MVSKIVLMSGVPGSGKSTYTKKLGGVVCSRELPPFWNVKLTTV